MLAFGGQTIAGVTLCLALAIAAILLGRIGWFATHGLSALTVAILLGIVVGNTYYPGISSTCSAGVMYSKQTLLRIGIVLYGLRLTLQDIGHVGVAGVLIDALVLSSTFGLALLLGTRVFKLDRTTAILIGAGSSICGAAAVMATEPVVRAHAEKVTVAVSTVVVFGTLAIFLYPTLFALNQHWGFVPQGAHAFGIYAGSTIHEVAQVVAAARSIGIDAANTAVITKMVRVMMLAPFLITLSAWLSRTESRQAALPGQAGTPKLAVPWFAFIFIGTVIFNSFSVLPKPVIDFAINLDTLLLAMAMAALGLTTHVSAIRKAGIKPLMLAAILFAWLIGGGALINSVVTSLLT
ncbi:MAG TPA: YeiH family putative sulfate export transporter [Burkholderiaceae bacterium]|nr:YeiH family putative sulfate export transporter [Burkholderiaceae bacterium]